MTFIDLIENAVESIQDKKKEPYFRYGDILEVSNETTTLNRILSGQNKKFPFIYMNTNFEETVKGIQLSGDMNECLLTLWIVNRSNLKYDAYGRNENEMPKLRTIRDNLVKELQRKGVSFEEYKRKELFYRADENEFNTPVNVIRIEIDNANYCLI